MSIRYTEYTVESITWINSETLEQIYICPHCHTYKPFYFCTQCGSCICGEMGCALTVVGKERCNKHNKRSKPVDEKSMFI